MKNLFLLITFVILYCEFSYSQDHVKDSIKAYSKIYTEKVYTDTATAKLMLHKTLTISNQNNYKAGIVIYYVNLANYHVSRSRINSAIDAYRKALEILPLKDEKLTSRYQASIYQGLGGIYRLNSKLDSAAFFLNEALIVQKKHNNYRAIAGTQINLSAIHFYEGDYNKANELIFDALRNCEKFDDVDGQVKAQAYLTLGASYQIQEDFKKALDSYNEARKIFLKSGNERGVQSCFDNIGNIYYYEKDFPKAEESFRKAVTLAKTLKDTFSIAAAQSNLGACLLEQNKLEEGREMLEAALVINSRQNNSFKIVLNKINLGKIEYELGNYDKAILIFQEALKISKEVGSKPSSERIYSELVKTYAKVEQAQTTLDYFNFYRDARDSVFNEEKQKSISELEKKYETEKKEQEIVVLNAENDLKEEKLFRNRFIAGAVSIIGLLLAYLWWKSIQHRKNIQVAREAENHTTSNSYKMISSVFDKQMMSTSNELIKETLKKAKELVITANSINKTVKKIMDNSQNGDIYFREGFLGLCKDLSKFASYSKKVEVISHCDKRIKVNPDVIQSLFLLIDELFTNSNKYAFATEENPIINVSLIKKQEGLVLKYSDNGSGLNYESERINESERLMRVIKSFLPRLGGKFEVKSENGLHYSFFFQDKKVLIGKFK